MADLTDLDLDRIEQVARARAEGSAWDRVYGRETLALTGEVRRLRARLATYEAIESVVTADLPLCGGCGRCVDCVEARALGQLPDQEERP